MKVFNMTNNNGSKTKNQIIIRDGQVEYFQSYDTIIARINWTHGRAVQLDENYWNYSATTGRFRNQFLGEGVADTRKKIDSGEYKLVDLN